MPKATNHLKRMIDVYIVVFRFDGVKKAKQESDAFGCTVCTVICFLKYTDVCILCLSLCRAFWLHSFMVPLLYLSFLKAFVATVFHVLILVCHSLKPDLILVSTALIFHSRDTCCTVQYENVDNDSAISVYVAKWLIICLF